MNPLDSNNNSDVAKYFKNLGYEYSWDFSRRDGLHWHEIGKNGQTIIQVEMVPLDVIVKDMCRIEEFKTDYFLAGVDYPDVEKDYEELCKKVRKFEASKSK